MQCFIITGEISQTTPELIHNRACMHSVGLQLIIVELMTNILNDVLQMQMQYLKKVKVKLRQ